MIFPSRLRRRLLDLLFVLAAVVWFPLFWLIEKTVWRRSSSRPQGSMKKDMTLSRNRTFGEDDSPPTDEAPGASKPDFELVHYAGCYFAVLPWTIEEAYR